MAKQNEESTKTYNNSQVRQTVQEMEKYKAILSDGRVGDAWKNSAFGNVVRLKKSDFKKQIQNMKSNDEIIRIPYQYDRIRYYKDEYP